MDESLGFGGTVGNGRGREILQGGFHHFHVATGANNECLI